MMRKFKNTENGYIVSLSTNYGQTEISDAEFENIKEVIRIAPIAPEGYVYMLRDDTLEWDLTRPFPIIEPEPTPDEALTRYANELTGENGPDLVSATETLIKHFTEE